MSSTIWLCLILLVFSTSSYARPKASPGITGHGEVIWAAELQKEHPSHIHQSLKDVHAAASQAVHDAHNFVHQKLYSVVKDVQGPPPARQLVEPLSLVSGVFHQTLGVVQKPSSNLNFGLNVQLGGSHSGHGHGGGFQLGVLGLHQHGHGTHVGIPQQNTNFHETQLGVAHQQSHGIQGTVHDYGQNQGASLGLTQQGQSSAHINQGSHIESSVQHSEQTYYHSSSHQSSHFESSAGHHEIAGHSLSNQQNFVPQPCPVCGPPVKTNSDISVGVQTDNATDLSKVVEEAKIERDDIDIRFGE